MKRIYILSILAIILTVSAQAQPYHPFPDSTAIWNIKGDNVFDPILHYRIRWGQKGDTTFGAHQYQKIYLLYDSTNNSAYDTYFAAIREENKRIYVNFDGVNEEVIYDFHLSVGDSIHYTTGGYVGGGLQVFLPADFYRKVLSVDSIQLYNGEYRRLINMGGNNLQDTWVEGIGSIAWAGLFNPFVNDFILNGDNYDFVCFKENANTMYLNNPDCNKCFCDLLSQVDRNKDLVSDVTLSPNPSSGPVRLNVSMAYGDSYAFRLYQVTGVPVMNIPKVTQPFLQLDVSGLQPGVYLYQVVVGDRNIYCGKLIVK